MDYLHRFFDYTQAEGGLAGAPPAGAGGTGQDEAAARSQLQSAALSLGAMHAQLGHVEEAMQALNETVRRCGLLGGGGGLQALPCSMLWNRTSALALHCQHTVTTWPPPPLQVRIAQQSSDDACLAHALASLCQVRRCMELQCCMWCAFNCSVGIT